MSENHPVAHPLPEGVGDDFTYACKDCGGTVKVVASTRQPHACHTTERDELFQLMIGRTTTKAVERILAAGYRRPRTVTTTDELAALAVGSVVLHNGRAFQHYPEHPAPFDEYKQWKCADGGFVRSTKDGSSILPATVLHEPEASE